MERLTLLINMLGFLAVIHEKKNMTECTRYSLFYFREFIIV